MDRLERIVIPPTSTQVTDEAICYLEPSVYASRQVRVAGAGRERCLPDYLIERNNFPCFTLELVVGGRGKLVLDGESHQLLPGHIFLYGPGMPVMIRTDPTAPMLKYFIEFFGNAKKIFHSGILAPGEIRRISEMDHLAGLCEQLIAAGRKNLPNRQAVCAAYLNLILIKTTEVAAQVPQLSVQLHDHVERCRHFIERNCSEIHNLETLGQAVHLDRSYICRIFKQFKLPSPHRYIDTCRMNRAVELLLSSTSSIKSVAATVGYLDSLHFSRNFRRRFNCSPSDFRSAYSSRRLSRASPATID